MGQPKRNRAPITRTEPQPTPVPPPPPTDGDAPDVWVALLRWVNEGAQA